MSDIWFGLTDDTIHFAIVKKGLIVRHSSVRSSAFVNGNCIDITEGKRIITSLVKENRVYRRTAGLFVKTTDMMSRLRELPPLKPRDIKKFKEYNKDNLFPVVPGDYTVDSAVIHKTESKVILNAAALPAHETQAYTALFNTCGITLSRICPYPSLVFNALSDFCAKTAHKNAAAFIENREKTIIAVTNEGAPFIVKDTLYSEESFTADYESILSNYAIGSPSIFFFIGERYNKFHSYFQERGETVIVDITFALASTAALNRVVNLLPPTSLNALKLKKAFVKSAFFLIGAIFCLQAVELAAYRLASRTTLEAARQAETVTDTDYTYADTLARNAQMLELATRSVGEDNFANVLQTVTELLPPDVRIVSINAERLYGSFDIELESKTDSALLVFVAELGALYTSTELTHIAFEDDKYRFKVHFTYETYLAP